MTMSSSSTHNSSIITNSNNEALVDKLQDALAAFRRERDELHRQKMLTEERLRLLQEEHASLHQTTSTTAEKLSQMEASASSSKALEELKALEVQVARLQQEFNFQHAELVDKRSKVDSLRQSLEEQDTRNQIVLDRFRTTERERRATFAGIKRKTLQQLEHELEHELELDLLVFGKLARYIQLSMERAQQQAAQVHADNQNLSKLLMGYKQRLDDAAIAANASQTTRIVAMQQ